MKIIKEYTLMGDNTSGSFAEDIREAFLKAGFPEPETDFFSGKIVGILDDYAACAGKGAKVKYRCWKSPVNMEFRILIPGEPNSCSACAIVRSRYISGTIPGSNPDKRYGYFRKHELK